MFEAQVLGLLQRYLGKYVYGLDAESLRISVWRGDVELSNLRLKPEALDELNLPITVKSGLLGRLRLKVRLSTQNKGQHTSPHCVQSSLQRHRMACPVHALLQPDMRMQAAAWYSASQ
jgi:hypothetical protein